MSVSFPFRVGRGRWASNACFELTNGRLRRPRPPSAVVAAQATDVRRKTNLHPVVASMPESRPVLDLAFHKKVVHPFYGEFMNASVVSRDQSHQDQVLDHFRRRRACRSHDSRREPRRRRHGHRRSPGRPSAGPPSVARKRRQVRSAPASIHHSWRSRSAPKVSSWVTSTIAPGYSASAASSRSTDGRSR